MTKVIAANYLPKHLHQFDGTRYAGANCGCVACAHAIDWSTGGALRPSPAACRAALGGTWVGLQAKPATDATSLGDQARAWETFRDDARAKGLRLGSFTRNLMKPWDDAIAALDAGYALLVQFDHATWNDGPAASGDPAFRGFHVVFIPRLRRRNGRVEMLDYDGMFDGRRKGIPSGPQWVPAWAMRKAAEEKVRRTLIADGMKPEEAKRRAEGVAVFAVVSRSTPIARPKPVPPPEPPADPVPDLVPVLFDRVALTGLVARTDAGDRITVELGKRGADGYYVPTFRVDTTDNLVASATAERDARITALELALGTARTALLGLKNDDAIDAAIADIDAALPPADGEPDAGAVIGVGREA